jgi:hypothetical protein
MTSALTRDMYLHGAAQTEDAVVGFLGLQTLECSRNDVVLLGEQVIGPVRKLALALAFAYHGLR